jgi:prepilin-type N-terminal cleavage/methylation domain-containing protein
MNPSLTLQKNSDARGFSVIELLIVVAMISVILGFALLQIVRARQEMTRVNATQQLAAHLEKARLDSVRRRPGAAQMARLSIADESSYSITIDSDGDGFLNTPQLISLPAGFNLQFNGPFPRTIYFNWRGRTSDSAGVVVTPMPAFVTISNSYGSSQIDLTAAGQPSLDGAPASSTVVNSDPPPPTYRNNTQIP